MLPRQNRRRPGVGTARQDIHMVARRRLLVGSAVGAVALAGGLRVASAYAADMEAARARVSTGKIISTRFGALEYAEAGVGMPVLMIHGTGGGFDQGLNFCQPLLGRGYRIIAPSRFGYLSSDFPGNPSSENQADAFVELLDHLGIERLAVAGGSAGSLSAAAFALRHPDRCSALIALVPATYVPDRPATPGPTGWQEGAMTAMLRSDFLFWAALKTMPDLMIGTMLATDPGLVAAADTAEQERVTNILRGILPVSHRMEGLLNDARLARAPAPMDIATISAPTLAISLEDDRFGTAAAARYMASQIPGADLVIFPSGGHVWVGHSAEIFELIEGFLRKRGIAD